MEKIGLFPGSFNPLSLGHLEVITRASMLCSKLYVAVALNSKKQNAPFTIEERLSMVKLATESINNVEVVLLPGLLVDFAELNNVDFIIRGLRGGFDTEFEFQMASANRRLSGIETIFLMGDEVTAQISSSLIREIGAGGRRLHGFVPPEIEQLVFDKLSKSHS